MLPLLQIFFSNIELFSFIVYISNWRIILWVYKWRLYNYACYFFMILRSIAFSKFLMKFAYTLSAYNRQRKQIHLFLFDSYLCKHKRFTIITYVFWSGISVWHVLICEHIHPALFIHSFNFPKEWLFVLSIEYGSQLRSLENSKWIQRTGQGQPVSLPISRNGWSCSL